MNPYAPKYIPVQGDADGLIPELLRTSLASKWDKKDSLSSDSDIPKVILDLLSLCFPNKLTKFLNVYNIKVLYVNPAGANPSGVSIPLERRKEIYQIARDYDLIILEDDPYYFLQFEKVGTNYFLQPFSKSYIIILDCEGKNSQFLINGRRWSCHPF